MKEYVERANEFLMRFYPFLAKNKFSVEDAITEWNLVFSDDMGYAYGTQRECILGKGYVIKIDKNCTNEFGDCEDEFRLYKTIESDKYSYLFAEITRVVIKHHKFYIMPRIDVLAMEVDEWNIFDYISLDEQEYITNLGINDLHDENWGYLNGYPIIIDYAYYAL